jgi:hypothetical protein
MHDHIHVLTTDGRVIDLPEDLGRRIMGSVPSSLVDEIERRLGVGVSTISVQVPSVEHGANRPFRD